MRLTREKIVRISHQLSDLLVASNEVVFVEDRDTIRQHMVQTMTNVLREEEKVEVEVRKHITSQKKEIWKAAGVGRAVPASTIVKRCDGWAFPRRRKNTNGRDTAVRLPGAQDFLGLVSW